MPSLEIVEPNRIAAERAHKLPTRVAISVVTRGGNGCGPTMARMLDGPAVIGSRCGTAWRVLVGSP